MTNENAGTSRPRLSRPTMPAGYGLPDTPPDPAKTSWQRATEQLGAARNYWVSTAGAGGRPHVMPVWGLWMDGALYFSTGRASRKGRNLAVNPEVAVHLESGDDVVILEGRVREEEDGEVLARFVEEYDAKYGVRPDPVDPENIYYRLRPRVAFTWLERDFLDSAARWDFDRG